MDDDRLKALLERVGDGRNDMPNDEKHWLLNAGLVEWCLPLTATYGGPRTDFSGVKPVSPILCLTHTGKQKLAQLKQ